MEFRILGSLQVEADGQELPLPRTLRRVLAVLLLEANSAVSPSRIVHQVWGEPTSPRAEGTLRRHVHRLRQLLEPKRAPRDRPVLLVTEEAGYRLRVGPDQLDAHRFARLWQQGRDALRAEDPATAIDHLGDALALWRGRALADLQDLPCARLEAERLERLRLAVREAQIAANLALGRYAEAVSEAHEALVEALDHVGLRCSLALALYRSRRYEEAGRVCREGLERAAAQGLSPPPELQELQRAILDHAPELDMAPGDQHQARSQSTAASSQSASHGGPELPDVWYVPVHRQGPFLGRDGDLARLEERFARGDRVQTLHGLAGVGKTQLAVRYAHRSRPRYRVVWWLAASEPSMLPPQLAALAEALNLAAVGMYDLLPGLEAAQRWLASHDDWLLVIDDARDPAALEAVLPDTDRGHVLVTSTNPNWTTFGRVTEVRSLARPASVKVLTADLRPADQASARRLARALYDLPLALQQARAYMAATGRSAGHYLELLEEHPGSLLARGPGPHDHRKPVAATWELALEQVRRTAPAAIELMSLCSMLAPGDLALDLLLEASSADLLPPPLAQLAFDAFERDRALSALRSYSLLEPHSRGPAMHQLLQTVVRASLSNPTEWAVLAARLLRRALPEETDREANWPAYRRLLPSLLTVCGDPELRDREQDTRSWLLDRAATWLQRRGHFESAERLFRRSLEIRQRAYGDADLRTVNSLNNLGLLLTHLDPNQSRQLLEQAVSRHRELCAEGRNTSHLVALLADCLNNLGWAEHLAGQDGAGIAHLDEAIQTYRLAYGDDGQPSHAGVAHAWMNRGVCLLSLRRYADAEQSLLRALELLRVGQSEGGSDEATIWNNLAVLALAQGDPRSARVHHEKALDLRRRLLGRRHPLTGLSLLNLGAVLREIGQVERELPPLEEALDLHHAALELFSAAYGGDHPHVAQAINNLGLDLRSYGKVLLAKSQRDLALDKLNRAETRLRAAYDMRRRLYTPPHPELVQSLDNIGATLRELGRYDEAIRLHEQSLAMLTELEGDLTVAASSTLEHMALASRLAGNIRAAQDHASRALGLITNASGTINVGHERLAERLHTQLRDLA